MGQSRTNVSFDDISNEQAKKMYDHSLDKDRPIYCDSRCAQVDEFSDSQGY